MLEKRILPARYSELFVKARKIIMHKPELANTNQPVGFLGLAFRQKTQLKPEELELIHALANQAALAIQLTSLAEEVKQEAQQAAVMERNRMGARVPRHPGADAHRHRGASRSSQKFVNLGGAHNSTVRGTAAHYPHSDSCPRWSSGSPSFGLGIASCSTRTR